MAANFLSQRSLEPAEARVYVDPAEALEIAFALKFRVPVIVLAGWALKRPDGLNDPLLFEARSASDAA